MDKKTGLTIKISKGCYAIKTPRKDAYLLELIKGRLKPGQRAWDPEDFVWLIHPSALMTMKAIITQAGYDLPIIPDITQGVSATIEKTFIVEYLGQCKDREGGAISALGQVDGYWSIEFPEDVLKAYFHKNGNKPLATTDQTLYQILCVFENVSDQDLKSAHRKLARMWHPDICSEPEAAERFMEIDRAYKTLADPAMRARYDAGLYFEREAAKRLAKSHQAPPVSARRKSRFIDNPHYRAPLRCGLVTVRGIQTMNKFKVSELIRWDDARDDAGRTMVSSWDKQAKAVIIRWI